MPLFDTASIVALRLLSLALALAYVKLYTGRVSAAELGTFFYLTTLSYAINALLLVPVDYFVQTRLSDLVDLPLSAISKLLWGLAIAAALMTLVIGLPLFLLEKIQVTDFGIIFATALLLYACLAGRGLLNNRGHRIFAASMLVLENGGRAAMFAIAVLILPASARMILYSAIVALAVELAVILLFMRARLSFTGTGNPFGDARSILRLSYPLSISAVGNFLQLQTYRMIYVWFGAPATAATYAVVSNLGAAGMNGISSVYSQTFLPRLYASRGDYFPRYARNAIGLTLTACLGAAIFGPWLVRLVTHPEYAPYVGAVQFGIIAEAGNLLVGAATIVLMFRSQTMRMIPVNVIATLISLTGQVAALTWAPNNPYAIGWPIVASQLLATACLLVICINRGDRKHAASAR